MVFNGEVEARHYLTHLERSTRAIKNLSYRTSSRPTHNAPPSPLLDLCITAANKNCAPRNEGRSHIRHCRELLYNNSVTICIVVKVANILTLLSVVLESVTLELYC